MRTVQEMTETMLSEKQSQRIYNGSGNYKVVSDEHKGMMISAEIANKAASLRVAAKRDRVNLNDLEQVQTRTQEYFKACEEAHAFPSVMGLSVYGFGMTRQAVNEYLLKHPNSPSTNYINMTKDIMADILTNESLNNNANPVQAIFQLKNHFGHSDTQTVEVQPVQMKMKEEDRESLAERIAQKYLVDLEEE